MQGPVRGHDPARDQPGLHEHPRPLRPGEGGMQLLYWLDWWSCLRTSLNVLLGQYHQAILLYFKYSSAGLCLRKNFSWVQWNNHCSLGIIHCLYESSGSKQNWNDCIWCAHICEYFRSTTPGQECICLLMQWMMTTLMSSMLNFIWVWWYCIPNSCKYSVQYTFSRLELKFWIILALFQEEKHSGFVKKEPNSVLGYQEFLISTNGCTSVSIYRGVEMKIFSIIFILRFGIWCLQR